MRETEKLRRAWANNVYIDAEWSPYEMTERTKRAQAYIRGVNLRRIAQHCLRTEKVLRLLIVASAVFLAAVLLANAI